MQAAITHRYLKRLASYKHPRMPPEQLRTAVLLLNLVMLYPWYALRPTIQLRNIITGKSLPFIPPRLVAADCTCFYNLHPLAYTWPGCCCHLRNRISKPLWSRRTSPKTSQPRQHSHSPDLSRNNFFPLSRKPSIVYTFSVAFGRRLFPMKNSPNLIYRIAASYAARLTSSRSSSGTNTPPSMAAHSKDDVDSTWVFLAPGILLRF